MDFRARARILVFGVIALGLAACGKQGPTPSKLAQKAPEKTEDAEKAEPEEAKKPPVKRGISRPDEYFHFTVTGPIFDSPQKFTFDPDSVRINVVQSRAAIQYVRKANEPATSADGSQVVVSQIQWAGGVPGEYVKDEARTFVITLGIENRAHETATLQLASGKLVADAASMSPRELEGSFEGKLQRQNDGKDAEVYEISGAFNLVE